MGGGGEQRQRGGSTVEVREVRLDGAVVAEGGDGTEGQEKEEECKAAEEEEEVLGVRVRVRVMVRVRVEG